MQMSSATPADDKAPASPTITAVVQSQHRPTNDRTGAGLPDGRAEGCNCRPLPPSDDRDWLSFVELKIAPHPRLTAAQAKAIALDYGLARGRAGIRVRRALLFYALRRLGLDLAPDVRAPQEQHIVLANRREIEALARPAGSVGAPRKSNPATNTLVV
jgi:hypothetical protein